MSLKSSVVVAAFGRDTGKTFLLTEQPAIIAEKWALRFFLALKGTGAVIDDRVMEMGYVAVAVRGINSFLAADVDFAKIEPLLDEMLGCVQIIRDKSRPEVATPLVPMADIMEVRTLIWLRGEVLSLHAGFSVTASLSALLDFLRSKTPAITPDP
jgi:hypothetical protein